MSPSVDVTIELDQLNVGKVNIVKNKTLSFTGKALNVAIGISRLGADAYATGFMYNENGAMFERALDKEGVPFAFVWNSGRVRENYKCIDKRSMLTEINDVGGQVAAEKLGELSHMIRNLSSRSDVTVISGGLPRGVDASFYREIFRCVDPKSLRIADTEGAKMFAALEAGIDLVKHLIILGAPVFTDALVIWKRAVHHCYHTQDLITYLLIELKVVEGVENNHSTLSPSCALCFLKISV